MQFFFSVLMHSYVYVYILITCRINYNMRNVLLHDTGVVDVVRDPFVDFSMYPGKLRCSYVPEVLNVHVNESKKNKSTLFRKIFF